MKTQLLVLLVAVMVGLVIAKAKTGSNFCQDEKERHDTCKPLVQEDCETCSNSKDSSSSSKSKGGSSESKGSNEGSGGSNEGSGSGCDGSGDSAENSGSGSGCDHSSGDVSSGDHSSGDVSSGSGSGSGKEDSGEWENGEYCFILQIFWKFSLTLDIELQIVFQEWINITQFEIIQNKELTEYEILVEFYYSLQILFEKHIEIKTAIEFLYIGEWGYVCDLEGLVLDIVTVNVEITIEQVITIVGGTCPLLEALEECKANATSTQEEDDIEVLIQELTVIIQGSFSFSHKLTLIYKKIQAFIVQHPNSKELIFNGKIKGFAIIKAYFEISAVYWRIDNFSFAVGGSVSDCKLIKGLKDWYSNTSSGSTSQRSSVKELSDKLTVYFQSEVSVELRVKYFAEQLYQFYILEEWSVKVVYSIKIEGYGSLYQLIYAYVYCQNNGVNPGDFSTPSTTTPSTTSTTTTSTTTTTTTTTTTKPNGNCGTVSSVNVVSANITLLLQAIDDDQKTAHWNATLISNFLGYKKKIYNLSVNGSLSVTEKFNSIKTTLTGFTTKADFKAIVYAVFIKTWGTIGQYCGCSM